MIAHWEIIQKTDEWHQIRYRKVGGSTSKGLFVDSDTLLIQLIGEHLEEFDFFFDSFESADMQRGSEFEPLARVELEKYTGHTFKECGWLQCEEIPLLGISPDGITECLRYSAEIKCPAMKRHTATILNDEIPLDNIHQCVHYFTVNPLLEKHYFCSFRPENNIKPLFVKELTRDSIVNLGTEKKPILKPIHEWVEISKAAAKKLQEDISSRIESLKF